jgi:hypothetical protein
MVVAASIAAALIVALMPSAGAGAAVRGSAVQTGLYHNFFSGGSDAYMTVNADNTWSQQITNGYDDTGYWVSEGSAVALAVTSREDAGCLYLGKVTKTGINTKRAEGPLFCPYYGPNTWYGCNAQKCYVSGPPARAVRARSGSAAAADDPATATRRSVGTSYTFVWADGQGSLTFGADNAWSMTFSGPSGYTDTGDWVSQGASVVLTVTTGGDTGCVYLGQVDNKGIGTERKQGPYNCLGTTGTWYATTAGSVGDASSR